MTRLMDDAVDVTTDEGFLDYCESVSRTVGCPLYSRDVVRLYELAGFGSSAAHYRTLEMRLVTVGSSTLKNLVDTARTRRKIEAMRREDAERERSETVPGADETGDPRLPGAHAEDPAERGPAGAGPDAPGSQPANSGPLAVPDGILVWQLRKLIDQLPGDARVFTSNGGSRKDFVTPVTFATATRICIRTDGTQLIVGLDIGDDALYLS